MKRIKYLYNIPINHGDEENPTWEDCLYPKDLLYSETAEEIAKAEAYNGEYTVIDDGLEEIITPTLEERTAALEAAVMMLCMPDIDEV